MNIKDYDRQRVFIEDYPLGQTQINLEIEATRTSQNTANVGFALKYGPNKIANADSTIEEDDTRLNRFSLSMGGRGYTLEELRREVMAVLENLERVIQDEEVKREVARKVNSQGVRV